MPTCLAKFQKTFLNIIFVARGSKRGSPEILVAPPVHLANIAMPGSNASDDSAGKSWLKSAKKSKRARGDSSADSGDRKAKRSSGAAASRPRVTQLKPWNSMASKMLNPWGPSQIKDYGSKKFYDVAAAGDKMAEYHCEICSDDPVRRGIGISRMAQTMLGIVDYVLQPNLDRLIHKDVLEIIQQEATELRPHLLKLNMGPQMEKTKHDDANLKIAAKALHDWFKKPAETKKMSLRTFIALQSHDGQFFAAQVQDKLFRGWINHNNVAVDTFQNAVIAKAHANPTGNDDNSEDAATGAKAFLQ